MPPADLPPDDRASAQPSDSHGPPPAAGVAGLQAEVEVLHRSVARLDAELVGLRRAMASRAVIDQAKGAVRVVTGVSGDEAFALLAARSQHANRKLVDVAADVVAAVVAPDSWRTRRRWDASTLMVTDHDQLLALADLGENLAAAADLPDVLDVLLHVGADALGAFGAGVAVLGGTGAAEVETVGLRLGDGVLPALSLDAAHPATEVLRSGGTLVLSRADLALRFPDHPRPVRLRGMVVLPVAGDSSRPTTWSLYLDRSVPADRGTRAFFDRAGRLASGAITRAARQIDDRRTDMS